MIIRQHVDNGLGNVVRVLRVLRVETRLYVEVWQTCDVTEPTLMRAVNKAVVDYRRRCHQGGRHGEEEG